MHDAEKLPRAAIGDLTRSKNHVVINPFPAGQALAKKLQAGAVHFSSSSSSDERQCIVYLTNTDTA